MLCLNEHCISEPPCITLAWNAAAQLPQSWKLFDIRPEVVGSGFSDSLTPTPPLSMFLHWRNRNILPPSTAVLTAKWHLMLLPSSSSYKFPL